MCESNEKEELRELSSGKETMIGDIEEGRSFMKIMKRAKEMTEAWGACIEWALERKPSTLMAINLPERKLPAYLMRVWWRPSIIG